MNKQIQPKDSLVGDQAVRFEVSDHRVISGSNAIQAQGEDGQPGYVPAQPAIPGNVDSQIAFYSASGTQLIAKRARLTAEQYAQWNSSVVDDDEFFWQCHASNFGVVPA